MEIYKNLQLEDLEGEIWIDIKDWEGKYQISNLGRVKSLPKFGINPYGAITKLKDTTIRKQVFDKKGYLMVKFSNGAKFFKNKKIHRLLAEAFIPNPNNLPQINHKNGIKHYNTIENLEWTNNSGNQKHAFKLGLNKPHIGENNFKSKLKNNDIIDIRNRHKNGESYSNIAKDYPVSSEQISTIVKRKNWKHIK